MTNYQAPYIIAEAGCNHKGEMEIAKKLIKVAAIFCKANAIKFQKRNNKELLTAQQYNAPHPNQYNSYGDTYGAHREYLEFSVDQHKQLKERCEEFFITYAASVWDLTSAKEIASLQPKFIKIPSACNNHFSMLAWLCDHYAGEIQVSFGMTTREEEKEVVELFTKYKRNKDLVIFPCTSGYPVPFIDVCLREITRLNEMFGGTVKKIGFSGHHLGIAVDIAAYTLGAEVMERHYTLARTWKGTDHAASLEPDGIRKLIRNLHAAHQALAYKSQEVLPIEQAQRDKLKYRG